MALLFGIFIWVSCLLGRAIDVTCHYSIEIGLYLYICECYSYELGTLVFRVFMLRAVLSP